MIIIVSLAACIGGEDILSGTDVTYGRVQYANATAEEMTAAQTQFTDPALLGKAASTAPGFKEEFFEGDEAAAVAWAQSPDRIEVLIYDDAPQNTIEVHLLNGNERPLKALCDSLLDAWLKDHWAEGEDAQYRYHLARPCSKWSESVSPPSPPEIVPVEPTEGTPEEGAAPAPGTPP